MHRSLVSPSIVRPTDYRSTDTLQFQSFGGTTNPSRQFLALHVAGSDENRRERITALRRCRECSRECIYFQLSTRRSCNTWLRAFHNEDFRVSHHRYLQHHHHHQRLRRRGCYCRSVCREKNIVRPRRTAKLIGL